MPNLVGVVSGRYHIMEQVGEGGMATVYKAFDAKLERYVALKIIRTDIGQGTDTLQRFRREARALAQLTHPNIVHIKDYGEQSGVPYLVMDYLPGGTLKQKLGHPMPYDEAARLLAPIARALEYAHQQKIVHRDVKPANILLTEFGRPHAHGFRPRQNPRGKQTAHPTDSHWRGVGYARLHGARTMVWQGRSPHRRLCAGNRVL